MSGYTELHCHSCFSLLDGASTPEALADRALELGMSALALTDHDGLYGAIRFSLAAKERGLRPIIGAELTLEDESHLVLLAKNKEGYANLCWLISRAQLGGSKGNARLPMQRLHDRNQGLFALTGCRHGAVARSLLAGDPDGALAALQTFKHLFGDRLYVELQQHLEPEEEMLVEALVGLAHDLHLPLVATNNVHYARREGHRLQDVLVAIRRNLPVAEAQEWLRPNSEYHIKSAAEMQELFVDCPEAVANALELGERCQLELAFRDEALPPQPECDEDPQAFLTDQCYHALPKYYPQDASRARKQLDHELQVIQQTGLAGYFLLVWDIVRYAQRNGILVRGRGSAANSIVAYMLGITNVDPIANDLLFERFLSTEVQVMPDIDLDFCARRREEVIQYLYERYGESYVGMVCNYVTYRRRSAARDVGKALGLPPDAINALLHRLAQPQDSDLEAQQVAEQCTLTPEGVSLSVWEQFLSLYQEIMGLPRHLSIHVGGMCITRSPLDEIVPLERATMPGRVVIQWDKDALEDAGLIKIDILSLRTFSAIDECLQSVEQQRGECVDLDGLPLDDPAVYEALCHADTVGAFQVESRAQQQALVKMRPRIFADIIVEVALIRPGPLQGNMVHPFFMRRMGLQPVEYMHPMLKPILQETLGVVVFQEQVIRIAMRMGQFTAGEADLLRRAMSRHRSEEELGAFRERFIAGARAQGVPQEVADGIFSRLLGFASYGFCKSHAASFAKTAYDTLWLRAHYPAEYYCAILNNEPMGFYAPRVIVSDARRHGVGVLPVHLNKSQGPCTVEGSAIRLGLQYVDGLGEAGVTRVLEARESGPFRGLQDFCRRTRLPRRLVENLILARGMEGWSRDRRRLLWELGRLRYQEQELPLAFAEDDVELDPMTYAEELLNEYGVTGVSANGHFMELYRERMDRLGVMTSLDLSDIEAGSKVKVAGSVVIRQKPPTAKGFVFLTLEDEWGLMNVIVKPAIFQACQETWSTSFILVVGGCIERADGYVNIVAESAVKIR